MDLVMSLFVRPAAMCVLPALPLNNVLNTCDMVEPLQVQPRRPQNQRGAAAVPSSCQFTDHDRSLVVTQAEPPVAMSAGVRGAAPGQPACRLSCN